MLNLLCMMVYKEEGDDTFEGATTIKHEKYIFLVFQFFFSFEGKG